MVTALINDDYSIGADIDRYQRVWEHALERLDFSIGTGIYVLRSDLNLIIGKTAGCNWNISMSSTEMEIGSNTEFYHKNVPVIPPKSGKSYGAVHWKK